MNKKLTEKTILTIAKAAVQKGIHNPHQLHIATGISAPRCNKLWKSKGKVKIELADIDAICDNLPCKIKDIITRVPIGDKSEG